MDRVAAIVKGHIQCLHGISLLYHRQRNASPGVPRRLVPGLKQFLLDPVREAAQALVAGVDDDVGDLR